MTKIITCVFCGFFFLNLGFSSLTFPKSVYGNIYSWIDKNGVRHFTNVSPPVNATFEEHEESQAVFKKILSPKNKTPTFEVVKAFDGDTIKVKGFDLTFTIRLVGIDSPEIGYKGQKSQPYSQKAKRYLTNLLENQLISIKSYGSGPYNRQLAEVFVGNKNINLEMIKAGLAEVYSKEESKAKQARIGMWVQGKRYKSPLQWRKEHPRK